MTSNPNTNPQTASAAFAPGQPGLAPAFDAGVGGSPSPCYSRRPTWSLILGIFAALFSVSDANAQSACHDQRDNDGDGFVDAIDRGCTSNTDDNEALTFDEIRSRLDDFLFAKCETFYGPEDGVPRAYPKATVTGGQQAGIYDMQEFIPGHLAMYQATQDHGYLTNALNAAEYIFSLMEDLQYTDGPDGKLEFYANCRTTYECRAGIAGTCLGSSAASRNTELCDPEDPNTCPDGTCWNVGQGTCVNEASPEYTQPCTSDAQCGNTRCANSKAGVCSKDHTIACYTGSQCNYGTCLLDQQVCSGRPSISCRDDGDCRDSCRCAPNHGYCSCVDNARGIRAVAQLAWHIKTDPYLDHLYGHRADLLIRTIADQVIRGGQVWACRDNAWQGDEFEQVFHLVSHEMMILLYLSRIPGLGEILGTDSEPVISVDGSTYTYSDLVAIKANKMRDALFHPCKGGTRDGFSCESDDDCPCPVDQPGCGAYCAHELITWGSTECGCIRPGFENECACRCYEGCRFDPGGPLPDDDRCLSAGGSCGSGSCGSSGNQCAPQDINHSEDVAEAAVELFRFGLPTFVDLATLAHTFVTQLAVDLGDHFEYRYTLAGGDVPRCVEGSTPKIFDRTCSFEDFGAPCPDTCAVASAKYASMAPGWLQLGPWNPEIFRVAESADQSDESCEQRTYGTRFRTNEIALYGELARSRKLDAKCRYIDGWETCGDGIDNDCDSYADEGCGAKTLYVDAAAGNDENTGSSWKDALRTLSAALAQVDPDPVQRAGGSVLQVGSPPRTEGTVIKVAQGIYKPECSGGAVCIAADARVRTFSLLDHVEIRGGYAGIGNGAINPEERNPLGYVSVLSGDLEENDDGTEFGLSDNCYHVVTSFGTNPSAILDGFTIRGGNADLSEMRGGTWADRGAGLYNDGGDPTISNCVFENNRASGPDARGGAMYNRYFRCMECPNCQPPGIRVTDCTSCTPCPEPETQTLPASPTIRDCVFRENLATRGGAIFNERFCSPVIIGSTFVANQATGGDGGAMAGVGFARPITINSGFFGNSAFGLGADGGAVSHRGTPDVSDAKPTYINCAFSANRATGRGGAIFGDSADVELVHCTMSGNQASTDGGGFYIDQADSPTQDGQDGRCEIRNSILSGNVPDELKLSPATTRANKPIITFSDVDGGFDFQDLTAHFKNNISADPLFVDPDGADDLSGTPDDDLRLRSDSPCLNAARNRDMPLDRFDVDRNGRNDERISIDLDRNPRFDATPSKHITGEDDKPILLNVADMGAFEGSRLFVANASGYDARNGRTWDTAFGTVREALSSGIAFRQIWVAPGRDGPRRADDLTIGLAIPTEVLFFGALAGTEIIFVGPDAVTIKDAMNPYPYAGRGDRRGSAPSR